MINRLLGKFAEAQKDLATACKIDFDEQADEWLKEVSICPRLYYLLYYLLILILFSYHEHMQVKPNAKKLQDHQRKKERKVAERELKERQERVRRAREAQAAAAKEAEEGMDAGMDGGMGGIGGMGGLGGLFNDPEMMQGWCDDPYVECRYAISYF